MQQDKVRHIYKQKLKKYVLDNISKGFSIEKIKLKY